MIRKFLAPQSDERLRCNLMVDWALATTPPNAEHLVCEQLTRLNYDHLFFKRRTTRVVRGRVIVSMPPAFPRYIMVPILQCWDILHTAWRVAGIVCFGDEVARVREREIDRLVGHCNGGDVFPPDPIIAPYAAGERVHVGGLGLASGHDAFFDSVVGDDKLRLMFDMMGRMIPIDVDRRDISSSSPSAPKHRKRRKRRVHSRHTHRVNAGSSLN